MRVLKKFKTLYGYVYTGLRFGADFRSKWLLASMLPRLKWRKGWSLDELVYQVRIRIGPLRQTLFLRPADIFIVHEVLSQSPYILPEMFNNPPRRIVDLGAHIGLATIRFKADFPNTEVHCYEPDPENFRLLTANTQSLNGIVLRQEAVGAVSGEGTFYIRPGRHSASSLVAPEGKTTAIKCKVVALDEILQNLGQVDLIKFDIEGMEYEVFSASRLIHKVPFIVGELKVDEQKLERFLSLFACHQAQVQSVNAKIYFIHLWRYVTTY